MADNPLNLPTSGNGAQSLTPSGNGFDNRLRAVEQAVVEIRTELKHLATKEDIAELKRLITEDVQAVNVMIADREASMQRWLMGTLVTVIIALAVALFRLSSVAS